MKKKYREVKQHFKLWVLVREGQWLRHTSTHMYDTNMTLTRNANETIVSTDRCGPRFWKMK